MYECVNVCCIDIILRTIHNEHPFVAIASKTPLYYFETSLGIKNDDNKPNNKKGKYFVSTVFCFEQI